MYFVSSQIVNRKTWHHTGSRGGPRMTLLGSRQARMCIELFNYLCPYIFTTFPLATLAMLVLCGPSPISRCDAARIPLTLCLTGLLHSLQHQPSNLRWTLGNDRTGLFQRLDLVASSTLSARDDGTCVTHSSAWWGGPSGNESNDGLGVGRVLVVLLEVLCGLFLHGSTNLSNEHDTLGPWVRQEDFDDVDVLRSGEWVTANTHSEGLSKANKRGLARVSSELQTLNLLDSLVCETTESAKVVDVSTHVPDRETTPILPCLKMCPGMIPILQPSLMIPGQFPPIILEAL